MPLTVPPFSQFQGQLIPLRGLWRKVPPEGDYFVNCEIDWASQNTSAVQIALSGNSPVALSQIVALYVDNRRCGVDVDFQFPDSGFLLSVPAHTQVLAPALTNALMFYVIASGAAGADMTIVQILNSLPPPIPLVPSQQQNSTAVAGITLAAGSTVLIANTITGTLNTISLSVDLVGAASAGSCQIALQDGTGATLWANFFNVAANTAVTIPVNLTGLNIRFRQGVNLVISALTGGITGGVDANLYYTSP